MFFYSSSRFNVLEIRDLLTAPPFSSASATPLLLELAEMICCCCGLAYGAAYFCFGHYFSADLSRCSLRCSTCPDKCDPRFPQELSNASSQRFSFDSGSSVNMVRRWFLLTSFDSPSSPSRIIVGFFQERTQSEFCMSPLAGTSPPGWPDPTNWSWRTGCSLGETVTLHWTTYSHRYFS